MFTLAICLLLAPGSVYESIVEGARKQLDWRTSYRPGYFKIGFPKGDLPKSKGVCTDVVVRALRHAGYDLQVLIHSDMKSNWSKYPRYPNHSKPDTNIDHRRVPNQIVYFKRFGKQLPLNQVEPGEIIYWKLANGLDHVGIVSNRKSVNGNYLIVHNISGIAEEDCLRRYKWVYRFKFPK